MSTKSWIGASANIAQIDTFTVGGTPTAADTISITINGKIVTYTYTTSDTTAKMATGLQLLLSASQEPEFKEVAWTVANSVITGTASGTGVNLKPFTATASVSGSTTLTQAHPTASVSPYDWNNAANWFPSGVPANGDTIVFENGSIPCFYGLNTGITPANFIRRATYTGAINLPLYTRTGYREYRTTTLTFAGCPLFTIEQPGSDAAGQIKLDVGATAFTGSVNGTGNAGGIGSELLWLKATGSASTNTLSLDGGSVVLAAQAGDVITLASLTAVTGSTIRGGTGLTFNAATVTITASQMDVRSNIATLSTDSQAETWLRDTMTVGTFTNNGTCHYISNGTVTTLNNLTNGSVDYSLDNRARTITNKVNFYPGCSFTDANGTVTLSGGYTVVQGKATDCRLDFGRNRNYTVA